jgi:hypothetical protein
MVFRVFEYTDKKLSKLISQTLFRVEAIQTIYETLDKPTIPVSIPYNH